MLGLVFDVGVFWVLDVRKRVIYSSLLTLDFYAKQQSRDRG